MGEILDLTFLDPTNPDEVSEALTQIASEFSKMEAVLMSPKHTVSGVTGVFKNANGDSLVIKNGLVRSIRYYVEVPPIFTLQPTNQTVTAGDTAVFTYAHTGDTAQAYKSLPITQFTAPQFIEADWEARTGLVSDVNYNGATMTLVAKASPNYVQCKYFGIFSRVEVDGTIGNPLGNAQYLVDLITAVGAPNFCRVSITRGEPAWGDSDDLVIVTNVNGSETVTKIADTSLIQSFSCVLTTSGADLTYSMITDAGTFIGTIVGGISTVAEYSLLGISNNYFATFTKFGIYGDGFPISGYGPFTAIDGETTSPLSIPNVGTTGDPLGTRYSFIATNSVGDTESNIVETIEA